MSRGGCGWWEGGGTYLRISSDALTTPWHPTKPLVAVARVAKSKARTIEFRRRLIVGAEIERFEIHSLL